MPSKELSVCVPSKRSRLCYSKPRACKVLKSAENEYKKLRFSELQASRRTKRGISPFRNSLRPSPAITSPPCSGLLTTGSFELLCVDVLLADLTGQQLFVESQAGSADEWANGWSGRARAAGRRHVCDTGLGPPDPPTVVVVGFWGLDYVVSRSLSSLSLSGLALDILKTASSICRKAVRPEDEGDR